MYGKNKKYHSYKGEVGKFAPNIIKRDFRADKPNQNGLQILLNFLYMEKALSFTNL